MAIAALILLTAGLVMAGPATGLIILKRRNKECSRAVLEYQTGEQEALTVTMDNSEAKFIPLELDDTQAIPLDEMRALLGDVTDSTPDLGEQYFNEDPLGSYSLPAYVPDFLPTADEVFQDLVAQGLLTGVGSDIDAEWQEWNLVPV